MRVANGARLFAVFFESIDKETLASPRALDMVEMNAPKSEYKLSRGK